MDKEGSPIEAVEVKRRIKSRVEEGLDMSHYLKDEEIRSLIDRCILAETREDRISLKDKLLIRNELFNSLRRLDVLTDFLEDPEISEIMLVGTGTIFVEKKGRIIATDRHFENAERLKGVIQRIVADCDRKVNEAEPIVDARLKDGSRVNVVLDPVSLDGPALTIRRFPDRELDMDALAELGSFDPPMKKIFEALVLGKYNMLISGGTGSGKTTFLNALSGYIPKDERIITIEDSAELRIRGVKNLVRLETRNKSSAGEHQITIRDLIKTSLRMRPDRLIVGEVRDASACDMLQAMNTGQDGLTSCRRFLGLKTIGFVGYIYLEFWKSIIKIRKKIMKEDAFMDFEDMVKLIEAYDAISKINGFVIALTGGREISGEGYKQIHNVLDVLYKHSQYGDYSDINYSSFIEIIEKNSLTAEEKCKLLML